jgi:trans-aconitate methyltransferase
MTAKNYKELYDKRYDQGYNPLWPLFRKQRIFKLIQELNLPQTGKALDFGCGRGEFTEIIKQALPEWDICGVDLSSVAVEDAKKRCPDCSFLLLSELGSKNKDFDFIFSNHVLEHVEDLENTFSLLKKILKPDSSLL